MSLVLSKADAPPFLQVALLLLMTYVGLIVGANKGDMLNLAALGGIFGGEKSSKKSHKILDTSVIIDGLSLIHILRADPTPNSVALVWEGDTEPDLAGYRVYRSVGDGPWQKLADVNAVPSYSDTSVEHGKTYHYAIGAFDKTGNESARSTPVEIVP